MVTPQSVAAVALEIALGYAAAHIHEEGGNNRGDQVEFFQRLMGGSPGDPWCADFVCTCLVKGYARAHGLAEDRSALPGYVRAASALLLPLSGYCPSLAGAARAKGILRDRHFDPSAGDLVLYDLTESGAPPHHVGMIRSADAGSVYTIEGNTSSGAGGSQGNGDGVYPRRRDRGLVSGFVHFG